MNVFPEPKGLDDPGRLDLEVQRLVQRLRSMPVTRLSQPVPGPAGSPDPVAEDGPPSRAALAFALAQELLELTEAQTGGQPPRVLPRLPDHSAPDVLAVVAADLAEAIRTAGDRSPAAAHDGREAALACRRAVAAVRDLRAVI